jgi:hypothetical protein
MYKKIGVAALGTAVSLVAVAGCTASSTTPSGKTSGAASTAASSGGTGGSGSVSPASVLLTALTKATGDNSVTITGTVTGGTAGTTTKMSGVEQFSPLKSSITINSSGGAAGTTAVTAIYDGTNYYLNDPQLSSMAGGKSWVEFNLSSMGALGSSMGGLINSLKTESPTSYLSAMVASGDLKDVGTDTLNGVQTTEYTGTLTGAQAATLVSSVNGLTAPEVQELKQLFTAGGIQSETMTAWVNSDNLPVQVTETNTSTSLGTTTDITDFTDWGAPVTITDPPAAEVGTFTMPTG